MEVTVRRQGGKETEREWEWEQRKKNSEQEKESNGKKALLYTSYIEYKGKFKK